jgi:sugar phosphate isomerase/epimerase
MDRRMFVSAAGAALIGLGLAQNAQSQAKARRVMWAASVRNKSLDQRIEAATLGRFDAMSVFPIDYKGWRNSGLSDADIMAKIKGAGLKVATMDPFVQWTPGFKIPDGYPADYVPFIDHTEAQMLDMADALETDQINCVEGLGQKHETQALIDSLGGFNERAMKRGKKLTLEPMPISSIFSLADGWNIVKTINSPNLGLCFDTWHFWRAVPDHDLLASIPGNKITEVQLADAKKELNGDLLNDLLHHRVMPGDGDFDLATTVGVLRKLGAMNSVGPELFSDAMDAMGHKESGTALGANLDKWL